MRFIVLAALAVVTPTASVLIAAPAQAQTGQAVSRPFTALRLLGVWNSRAGGLRFNTDDGVNVRGQLSANGRTYWLKVVNDPNSTGVWVEWEKGRSVSEPAESGRMLLVPTADGHSFIMDEITSQQPIWKTGELEAQRATSENAWTERYYGHLLGDWDTSFGPAEVTAEGGHLLMTITTPSLRLSKHPEKWVAVLALPDGLGGETVLHGAWERTFGGSKIQGRAKLTLSADKKSWTGSRFGLVEGAGNEEWTGTRIIEQPAEEPAPSPAPAPQPPVVTPPTPAPAPAPVPPTTSFQSLNRFDVRLDRLWEARGYPTRQVHAFVTVKNVSASPQYLTSGLIKAVLTDGDGVAQERNQVWRASAEPAALFNSTPVIQPGAELKVRYVFNPDEGSDPAHFTLSEGESRAEFPVGGL